SPPSTADGSQLSLSQRSALLRPSLPPGHFVDPKLFVGADVRTVADLQYSEFTHRWSGLFVMLLGFCWLEQSRRGSILFRKAWPLVLVPFGLFIAGAADPEVWILRSLPVREIVANPQLLEHQIGAALVFLLAILGLRDSGRLTANRPLGW